MSDKRYDYAMEQLVKFSDDVFSVPPGNVYLMCPDCGPVVQSGYGRDSDGTNYFTCTICKKKLYFH